VSGNRPLGRKPGLRVTAGLVPSAGSLEGGKPSREERTVQAADASRDRPKMMLCRRMNWITGAQLLADRIGTKPAREPKYIPADAPALWHWCGVSPDPAPVATGNDVAPLPKPQRPVIVSSPARSLRLSALAARRA
jgi:hypothetical protein